MIIAALEDWFDEPVVLQPGAPRISERLPVPLERFRATLADRPGFAWVERTYERLR